MARMYYWITLWLAAVLMIAHLVAASQPSVTAEIEVDFVNDLHEDVKVLWINDENERETVQDVLRKGEIFLVQAVITDSFEFISLKSGEVLHKKQLSSSKKKKFYLSGKDGEEDDNKSSTGTNVAQIRVFNGYDEPVEIHRISSDGRKKKVEEFLGMGIEMVLKGPVGQTFVFGGKYSGRELRQYSIQKDDDGKFVYLVDEDEDDGSNSGVEDEWDDHHDEDEDDHHHDHEHENDEL